MNAKEMYRFEDLNRIAGKGGVFVVKIDGQRDRSKIYSVVLTGGGLGDDDYFHQDGDELAALIDAAVSHYYLMAK